MVTLDKNLCKNFTLRGQVFFFLYIILQLALTFFFTPKIEEFFNFTLFSTLVFCNFVILGAHILNISKTIFEKQILDLSISYQLPDVRLQEFYIHSAYVINN